MFPFVFYKEFWSVWKPRGSLISDNPNFAFSLCMAVPSVYYKYKLMINNRHSMLANLVFFTLLNVTDTI